MPIETAEDLAEFFDHEEFGTAVSYLPADGSGERLVTAIWDKSEVEAGFGQGRMVLESNRFTFLVTSIPKPAVGDFITIIGPGTAFCVSSEPKLNDDGTMWTCGAGLHQG
jgi:hypothetical protein